MPMDIYYNPNNCKDWTLGEGAVCIYGMYERRVLRGVSRDPTPLCFFFGTSRVKHRACKVGYYIVCARSVQRSARRCARCFAFFLVSKFCCFGRRGSSGMYVCLCMCMHENTGFKCPPPSAELRKNETNNDKQNKSD